jgi:alkylation response protein AidB-like acyl-CoA dehydrogenase
MCLTESHAGSDLGIIRTKAEPQADGSYAISRKSLSLLVNMTWLRTLFTLFLHATPKGTKGISLFIVPKFHVNADGQLASATLYVVVRSNTKWVSMVTQLV